MVTEIINKEQYKDIINTIKKGFEYQGVVHKPNEKIATALTLEYNLGIRISDIVQLKLSDFIEFGEHYKIDITEQKTNKKRNFLVNRQIYDYLVEYCFENKIVSSRRIIDVTTRQVQRILKTACDYLGYKNISTHSFRKGCARTLYENNNNDIELVRGFLQHSDVKTTQRYIQSDKTKINNALENHVFL